MIVPELKDGPLTFAELRCGYLSERSYSSGSGRDKVTRSVTYINTTIGEIEQTRWASLIRKLIEEAGEEALFTNLLEWVNENDLWLHKEADRVNHALVLHADRIFDDEAWVGFVQFNQKYRPERLKTAGLASVLTICCGKSSIVTVAQLRRDDGKVCCPHCGRFSEYEEIKKETS